MSGDKTLKVTLRNLYEKAKHAFLQRDLLGAERSLTLAFAQLPPPPPLSLNSNIDKRDPDGLDSQRRKWDVLRITLWTTLFMSKDTSSSSLEKKTNCPIHLGPIQFLEKLYSNSLQLFTPSSSTDPSSNDAGGIVHVPDQVVFLLVVSALKLDQVRLAKEWIEDWLVRRDPTVPQTTTTTTDRNVKEMTSYEKVVDVYVLHVLPRLGLWDDATEFLRYEAEMNEYTKQVIFNPFTSAIVVNVFVYSVSQKPYKRNTKPRKLEYTPVREMHHQHLLSLLQHQLLLSPVHFITVRPHLLVLAQQLQYLALHPPLPSVPVLIKIKAIMPTIPVVNY